MLKVLTISSIFPNNTNPVRGVFIKERTKYLAQKYWNNKVVAPVPYFPSININKKWYSYSKVLFSENIDGLNVYHPKYFVSPKIGMSLSGFFYLLSIISFIKKLRHSFPFEVIDAHYLYPDSFASILLGKYFNVPVVVTARGTDINQYFHFPLIKKYLLYTLKNAANIIVVSPQLKKKLCSYGIANESINVIPNGVNLLFFKKRNKNRLREELGVLPNAKVILSVGSLRKSKGFEYLINAFSVLNNKMEDDIYLFIIGYGDYEKKIRNIIYNKGLEHKIKLVGRVKNNEMYKWYNIANLFCFPSQSEGWPNVLLESISCGLPVLTTDVGAARNIITSNDFGEVIDKTAVYDAENYASIIFKSISRKYKKHDMITHAKKFSWEDVASSVNDIFLQVVNKTC